MIDDNIFNLFLIRHGQSEANVNQDLIGQSSDIKLTELGKQQSLCLNKKIIKENISFDFIYSSPYVRAFDTAKISTQHCLLDIILAKELVEFDAGSWEGSKKSEVLTDNVRLRMSNFNKNFLPPNGESISMVERRASRWLDDNILYNKEIALLSKYKKRPVNIAAFSHGLTIRCMLHYIMGFDANLIWNINIDNTSVSLVSFTKNGWKIQSINDTSHLARYGQEEV